jgi:hypothetical protein
MKIYTLLIDYKEIFWVTKNIVHLIDSTKFDDDSDEYNYQ